MSVQESGLLRSGSPGQIGAARSGYLPLSLDHVRVETLATIPVHLRAGSGDSPLTRFTLYSSESARFTEAHRQRLQQAGVRFIYIPMSHQARFREQVENQLIAMAADASVSSSTKAELVYETSLELINEVLMEQGVAANAPRLQRVAQAVSTLVVNDQQAFSHLFAAAQHDFYTATHMVNVGTWMVSLAYASGMRDMDELGTVCTAGMVHDVGKLYVPEAVLNKQGTLTEEDWARLRSHAALGAEHLEKQGVRDEVVLRVAREHHERMDGRGYPAGLKGNQIHLASRICAIVDSFDAMTALRPFKKRSRTIAEALGVLESESPASYDRELVQAWIGLLRQAAKDGLVSEPIDLSPGIDHHGRREHERFTIDCQARSHVLRKRDGKWEEEEGIPVRAHSISKGGLGFLIQRPREISMYMRIYMMGAGTLQSRILEGQVVRCRSYKDGWHEVGMKFCQPSREEAAAQRVC